MWSKLVQSRSLLATASPIPDIGHREGLRIAPDPFLARPRLLDTRKTGLSFMSSRYWIGWLLSPGRIPSINTTRVTLGNRKALSSQVSATIWEMTQKIGLLSTKKVYVLLRRG